MPVTLYAGAASDILAIADTLYAKAKARLTSGGVTTREEVALINDARRAIAKARENTP